MVATKTQTPSFPRHGEIAICEWSNASSQGGFMGVMDVCRECRGSSARPSGDRAFKSALTKRNEKS